MPFEDGKPSGKPQDVLTGFLNDKGEAQGRPVGVRDRQGGRAAGRRRRRQRGLAGYAIDEVCGTLRTAKRRTSSPGVLDWIPRETMVPSRIEGIDHMTLPMSWDEWAQHDGVALAARVRKGELTAGEMAQQAAVGIAKVNPTLSGVVELFDDAIAAPANNATNLDGPFASLPFLMKDLGPTMQGRLQEMGSLLMRGNCATSDTFLTGKMRQAGLDLIGRTTTPEFGVCSSADNPAVYVTRNPWDTDYTTCGSSAGSAAMVAAGAVPIAHATDGGGSIRIPAGVNGNIGLKVSRGAFSLAPHMSDLTGLVSIQGCESRSVRDTAAFVDHCRGPGPGEFMPFWTSPEPYVDMIKRDPGRLRIALSHQWGEYRAAPPIVAELERVGKFLEALAITLVTLCRPSITAPPSRPRPSATLATSPRSSATCWPRADLSGHRPTLSNPSMSGSGNTAGTPALPSGRACRRSSTQRHAVLARSSRSGMSS